MKKIAAFACILSFAMAAQTNEKACATFFELNKVLQERHYKPKPVDDSLSVYVFDAVMESLDDNRSLFLQEDYDFLARHKYKIDDYITGKECSFFSDFIVTYKKALERNKTYINEISSIDLPYYTKDTLYYSKKVYPYRKTGEKVKNFIRKKIVYDILQDISKISTNKDSLKTNLATLGTASKAKTIDAYLCKNNGLLNPVEGFENSIYNRFFSVFCSYFDPHSTYFNYSKRSSFVGSLATERYSLGLHAAKNDKEEIIIEEIVPGSPAYKSEKITKGDQLIKIIANDKEYTVTCTSLESIGEIVSSDIYKTVELTLRKIDGTVYAVLLEKEIMKADSNSAYSFVLGDKNPIGYIKIPVFYSAFDDSNSTGAAADVAAEVKKLKKKKINGLIIDLQFNTGGSMKEVIWLAGMFINNGPLSIVAGRDMQQNTIIDNSRGMIYNGPIVVLVNGYSASASEFFTGIMQDYNRAVIAGSTTMGKATMQSIMPLSSESEEDFIKITTDKFYRVTGKSSQYNGIVPDVAMPTYFSKLLPRESSLPTALKNDTLTTDLNFRRMDGSIHNKAVQLSIARVNTAANFKAIQDINNRLDAIYSEDRAPIPLGFDTVFEDLDITNAVLKDVEKASEKENDLIITAIDYIPATADEFVKSINDYRIKTIKTDPYIYESINILNDMNTFKGNKKL